MPESNFKGDLLELIKQAGGLPYLFVGSGLSRRYLGSESWVELLSKYANINGKNFYQYSASVTSERIGGSELLKLPAVATDIGKDFVAKFFASEEFAQCRDKYIKISGEEDMPLKIAVADYISKYKLNTENLDEILKQEVNLLSNAKIRGIITTNYDSMLEEIFPKFTKFSGQNELITSQLTLVHDIYKIHGSHEDPQSIVLTLKDYEKYLEINKYLVSKILTIFVENPIIFLGYSVSDHNIQTIIADIIGIAKDRNDIKDKIKDKMIIVEWTPTAQDSTIEKITKTVMGVEVPMTVIKAPDYIELFQVLTDLTEVIPQSVLKYVLQNLYLVQNTADASSASRPVMLIDKDSYSDENIDNLEIVIGFGVQEKVRVNAKGYEGVSLDDLMDDLMTDRLIKDGYKAENLIKDTIESEFPASFYTFVPIFKYLKLSGRLALPDPFHDIPKTKELYEKSGGIHSYSKFYSSPPSKKRIANLRAHPDFKSYITRANLDNDFVHDISALIEDRGASFIDVSALENFLKFQSPNLSKLSSGYKSKLLCIYDKLRYSI